MEPPTRRHPGDLICGQCGEGNDPVRHFCRRCGNSLDEAIAVRLPWYRRFFHRLFGVSASDLATVLPNIGRFAHPNLGIFG